MLYSQAVDAVRSYTAEERADGGEPDRLQSRPGQTAIAHRFKRGQSGNPGGRSAKSLPALLAKALDETVVVTIDGRRRKLTKREAIVAQMVDKSGSDDL